MIFIFYDYFSAEVMVKFTRRVGGHFVTLTEVCMNLITCISGHLFQGRQKISIKYGISHNNKNNEKQTKIYFSNGMLCCQLHMISFQPSQLIQLSSNVLVCLLCCLFCHHR